MCVILNNSSTSIQRTWGIHLFPASLFLSIKLPHVFVHSTSTDPSHRTPLDTQTRRKLGILRHACLLTEQSFCCNNYFPEKPKVTFREKLCFAVILTFAILQKCDMDVIATSLSLNRSSKSILSFSMAFSFSFKLEISAINSIFWVSRLDLQISSCNRKEEQRKNNEDRYIWHL